MSTFLKDLFEELRVVYADAETPSTSGLVPYPARAGNRKYIFVDWPDKKVESCWYSLIGEGSEAQKELISNDLCVRGTLVSVSRKVQPSAEYGDSYKLEFEMLAGDDTYIIRSGYGTSYTRGLVGSLLAYSRAELKDICIGVKPGPKAKVVYSVVNKGDGSWNKGSQINALEGYNKLRALLGQAPDEETAGGEQAGFLSEETPF